MAVRIENGGPPLTSAAVDEFEASIDGSLPEDYKAFLLQHNGGYPVPEVFDFADGSPASCVHYFFGLTGGSRTKLMKYALSTYRGRVPAGLLPVARDPGGNLVCVGLGGRPYGTGVFFWDHEFEADEGEPASAENVRPLAGSFTEFLAQLRD